MQYIEPSSHTVDLHSGVLQNATGRYEKRLKELGGLYADEDAFAKALVNDAETVVYHVTDQRPVASRGDLIFGMTHMQPGSIGNEFYMTRGHIHAIGNRPETYYGEAGEGVMLLESPDGQVRIVEIRPKIICYVPPLWIHRSINTGDTALVMSFCYPSDSGQDYNVIAHSNGMKSRIVASESGWKEIPNQAYRPRSQAAIDALLATCDTTTDR